MSKAIGQMEGFNRPGTIAARHHNPGNLRGWPGVQSAGGYAEFPDDASGWAALYTLVQRNIDRGLTMYEFFAGQRDDSGAVIPGGYPGYAPSADQNNPRAYAEFVAKAASVDPTAVLSKLA